MLKCVWVEINYFVEFVLKLSLLLQLIRKQHYLLPCKTCIFFKMSKLNVIKRLIICFAYSLDRYICFVGHLRQL